MISTLVQAFYLFLEYFAYTIILAFGLFLLNKIRVWIWTLIVKSAERRALMNLTEQRKSVSHDRTNLLKESSQIHNELNKSRKQLSHDQTKNQELYIKANKRFEAAHKMETNAKEKIEKYTIKIRQLEQKLNGARQRARRLAKLIKEV